MSFEVLHKRDERIASTSVNRTDEHGCTALHDTESLREFQLLLLQGLHPDVLDNAMRTPIDSLFDEQLSVKRRAATLNSTLVGTTVFGIGSNSNWQLGNQNDSVTNRVRKAIGVSDVTVLATSTHHSVVVARRGLAICGSDSNSIPRLGRGNGMRTLLVFESLLAVRKVSRIALSECHTLAVTVENEVFSWGSGPLGQLGIDDDVTIAATPHRVAITGLAVDVAASATHSVIATDCDLYLCGRNNHCQLGFSDKEAVLWKPRFIVSFHGKCAHLIGANSRSTIVVFGPARNMVVRSAAPKAAQAMPDFHVDYDENGDDSKPKSRAKPQRVALKRPTVAAHDNQLIFVIGCDQVLPERMHLGKPYVEEDGSDAVVAQKPRPRGRSNEWQVAKSAQKTNVEREQAACAALAMNEELIAFVSVGGALYVSPVGTSRIARRFEVPLRLAGLSVRTSRNIVALTDAGNVYEFEWSYARCTAWPGRLQRLSPSDATALATGENHSLFACNTMKPIARRIQVPTDFPSMRNAPTDLTLTVESGEQIAVHSSVVTRACPYFAAMLSSSMLESQLAAIGVDASILSTQIALAFAYGGRSLLESTSSGDTRALEARSHEQPSSGDGSDDSDDSDAYAPDRHAATSARVSTMTVQLTAVLLADVLQLADMWLMADLSRLCVQLIGEQLTVANVFDLIELAEVLTVDIEAPHPLLLEIMSFVKQNGPLLVSSAEFLNADVPRLETLDRILFGDIKHASGWSKFTNGKLVDELIAAQSRAEFVRSLKLNSLANERVDAIKDELSRRGLSIDVPNTAAPVNVDVEPQQDVHLEKQPVLPAAAVTVPPTHDEETFLDNAAEDFIDSQSVAKPVESAPVESPRRYDIRAELEASRASNAKSKMPRWRKQTPARATPPPTTATAVHVWGTEPAAARSPSSLTTIQNEQFSMSPDDPNNEFGGLVNMHSFARVASGASPQRRQNNNATTSHPSSLENKSSLRSIMAAEASATLAAELQAQFDREAAEEAWQVAMQLDAAERQQAIQDRRSAVSQNSSNKSRSRGGKALQRGRGRGK